MQQEWQFPNRATPEVSSAYYSVRFAPKALRNDLAALLAWRHQVHAVLDEVSDPGVARLKLQWWRDELGRTGAGNPRHPSSAALQPALERHQLPVSPFLDMAEWVESEILHQRPFTEADLDATCDRDLGALFELIARCHGLSDADRLATARHLGVFCARIYLIRDSGALARKGRTLLPVETLRTHQLTAETLTRRENRARLPDLLRTAATRARAARPSTEAIRAMPYSIRARTLIMETLLDEIEGDCFDVADRRIELTPLRKLWLAWRESRRP
jgi:15-cis-phytoene synthase